MEAKSGNNKLLIENIESDDYPIFQLIVKQVGGQPAQVFSVIRQAMQISPIEAKRLLEAQQFEVVRGARMEIESIQEQLERAGAKTGLIEVEAD